jgi:hypothetical protein
MQKIIGSQARDLYVDRFDFVIWSQGRGPNGKRYWHFDHLGNLLIAIKRSKEYRIDGIIVHIRDLHAQHLIALHELESLRFDYRDVVAIHLRRMRFELRHQSFS